MSRKKVTVVGGGFVGSTTAQRIVDLELADVVLTDILEGAPAGKALDMVESTPITRTRWTCGPIPVWAWSGSSRCSVAARSPW